MTIGGTLAAMGTRELRANLRAVVERVEAGNPVVCLTDGQPFAVYSTRLNSSPSESIPSGSSRNEPPQSQPCRIRGATAQATRGGLTSLSGESGQAQLTGRVQSI